MRTVLQLFTIAVLLACAPAVHAQEESSEDTTKSTPWISVSGSASITSDFYEFEADPIGSQIGRRPAVLHRLVISPTITIAGLISLPLNLMITFPETNTTTPALTAPSFSEFFTNPANALGLSSFSPKLGWAQFHLGSHTPRLSELSGGDLQLFGAGFDLRPGPVQVQASYGVAQRAIQPDATRGVSGAYRRDMTMARLGFGNHDTSAVGINVVYVKDDPNSLKSNVVAVNPSRPFEGDSSVVLPADTVRLRAEDGFITSIDLKWQVIPGITLSAEGAASVFTRDQSSALIETDNNPFSSIYDARTSTRVDGAGNANLSFRFSTWGVTLSALYMGAGFQPIAYPFNQSDRIDLKVSPMLNLLDGDLSISGTIGQRINNLSETKGEQLTQAIANGQLSVRFSDVVSLSSTYSNFGIRNNRQDVFDSARVQNVSESFSVDPMVAFSAASVMHTITASFLLDRFDDFNIVSGVESSNNTSGLMFSYSGMFETMPLTIGANASYTENALSAGTLAVRSTGVNASYRFLGGEVVPTISVTFAGSTFGANAADSQTFLRAGCRWRVAKSVTFSGSYGVNTYAYGNPGPRGTGFTEQMLQLALLTTF